jgi:ribosome-associated protein
MEDTANKIETISRIDKIKIIAKEIEALKGTDTLAIDISAQSSWTSYFIITTVSSTAHMKGILKELYGTLEENDVIPLWRHKKMESDKWVLIDCGDIVIHLMDKEAREFYDLEKLWFDGEAIYQSKSS